MATTDNISDSRPPLQATVSAYNATVDYLRFGAVMIIVLFHSQAPGAELGMAAVGFFVVAMTVFALGSARRQKPMTEVISARASRILRPWLVWTLIYGTAKAAQGYVDGEPVLAELRAWLPPQSPQGQLWFLPFAFLTTIALAWTAPLLESASQSRRGWAILCALATIASSAVLLLWTLTKGEPLGLLIFIVYLPALFFGILIFLAKGPTRRAIVAGAATLLGLGLAAAGIDGTQQLTIGLPVAFLALEIRLPETRIARVLGQLAMGVYLVHLLFIALLPRLIGLPSSTLAGGLAICAASTLAALAIDRSPARRILF